MLNAHGSMTRNGQRLARDFKIAVPDRDCLLFVKPDTVVKWHRRGWRYYWRRKSKAMRIGRPSSEMF